MIFYKAFKEGLLPAVWRDAHVTAIYKNKDEKTETNNNLPVPLTSVPYILYEKPIKYIIMKHLTDNQLFSDSQYILGH